MPDVFISYSRKDIAFARLLHEALTQGKVETWIDWARIPIGEKWWNEISAAISQSAIFLFIISSHSIGSEVCKKEVDQALSHNKRIIPVIVDDTPEAAIRGFVPDLTAINWIIFKRDDVFLLEARPDEKLKPEEQIVALPKTPEFHQAVEKLNTAIHTDWSWVKAHTRLETRALEWDQHKCEGSWLLRGKDLNEAEGWLAQAGVRKDPQPTDLQRQFVLASRKAESRRQRMTFGASLGALGLISILLVVAILARQTALKNLARSQSLLQAAEAENIMAQPNGNVETAALLSLRALQGGYIPQADAPLQKSLLRLYAVRTFSGHTDAVTSLAFSPDGKYLLTGSLDGTAKLWDVVTEAVVRTFSGHTGSVESVAFSPDGKHVLTGSSDKTANLWDATTGALVLTFSDPSSTITRTSVEMKRSNHGVAFSPDGKYVLTGSDDGNARLWDAATGALVRTFSGHRNIVRSVAFSPDGKYVLTGSLDDTARLWDATTGEEVRTFENPGWVLSAAFSPDGKYVLTGSTSDAILWDASTGTVVMASIGDVQAAVSIAFSPDGMYVLTVCLSQQTAKLWDVASGTLVRTFSGHTDTVESAAFSPDGNYVLTGSLDRSAKLWDATSNAQVRAFIGHTDIVESVAFSPDGKYVLTGSDDSTARLWDAATFVTVHTFIGHTDVVESVAFSPDGKYVLTGSDDGTAKLWDASTAALVRTFSGHANTVRSVAFSQDGKYLLTGSGDRTAKLWDAATGALVRTFNGHTQPVTGVAFSPDEKYVLTGSADWDAKLWDASTGAEVRTYKGGSSVQVVAFSPDGKYVLTGDLERTATLWDAATGAIVHTFSGHTGIVIGVAFSPDGKYVLTGSYDDTARLWDATTGELVRTFSGHTDIATGVAFSPDGKYVLVGSVDRTAELWDTDPNDTLRWACAHLTRDLTPGERTQYFITDDKPTCSLVELPLVTYPAQIPLPTRVLSAATATLPESATLAPVLNPIGPAPLKLDFVASDPFTSNAYGWPTWNAVNDNCTDSTTMEFRDDALLWTLDALEGNWCIYYIYPDMPVLSDFDTAIDIKRTSGSGEANFGIGFRIIDSENYYYFAINDAAQSFEVRRILNNSWSILANRIYEPAINPGEYNHLAVSARGKVLYFYINDTLVSTIENSGTDSGHIGLILKIINGNVSISYDNFLEQGIK